MVVESRSAPRVGRGWGQRFHVRGGELLHSFFAKTGS